MSFGHIEDVGRFNIIGDSVTLWGTIRCSVAADMVDLQTRLQRLAENLAAAHGCSATVEYLQSVPPVNNTKEWIEATLPTLRRAVGEARVVEAPATLGYDDVSEFVNAFGGVYLVYGVQDTRIEGDQLLPFDGGRGLVPNHNPAFYADDDVLTDSVRIHSHVAIDHLTGRLDKTQT